MDTIEHASRRRAFSIENGTNFLFDAFNGQNAFRTLCFICTFLLRLFPQPTTAFRSFQIIGAATVILHKNYLRYFVVLFNAVQEENYISPLVEIIVFLRLIYDIRKIYPS